MRVDREQFHRGDAERAQVVDDRRVGQARVGAAQRRRDVRMRPGEPLHVQFVDDRLGPGDGRALPGRAAAAVDHHAHRDEGRGVVPVGAGRVRVGLLETVDRGMRDEGTGQHPRVGVDEQLGRVVTQAAFGGVGPVCPQPVTLARPDPGQVAVADPAAPFGQPVALLPTPGVEQADLDRVRARRRHRDVDTPAVPVDPQRLG